MLEAFLDGNLCIDIHNASADVLASLADMMAATGLSTWARERDMGKVILMSQKNWGCIYVEDDTIHAFKYPMWSNFAESDIVTAEEFVGRGVSVKVTTDDIDSIFEVEKC